MVSSHTNNSPQGQESVRTIPLEEPDIVKVVLNQLSILVSTVTENNWESNHRQIRYILATSKTPIVYKHYLERLFNLSFHPDSKPSSTESSLFERLLKEEFTQISKNLNNLEVLYPLLEKVTRIEEFDIIGFVDRFDIDLVLAFIIVIKFQNPNQESVKKFIQENSIRLLTVIRSREFPSGFNWTLLLDHILNTPFFPLLHKIVTLSSLKAFKTEIEPVNRFYQTILKMSFKQLLIDIGPELVLPEKILPSLLQLKSKDLDESVALLLAEVLLPGSQGLSKTNNGVTALTLVNSLPEANARGAQLQSCFKTIEADPKFNINWYQVFTHVNENLYDAYKKNSQPTVANITQFMSSIDFKEGVVDIFLSYDWWFDKTLLYILHSTDPLQGGYNLNALQNLSLCFEDEKDNDLSNGVNGSRNILRFVNVGKLELHVLTKISQQNKHQAQLSEQEKKLNIYLGQVFEHDYRVFPEYLIAASLSIVEQNTFIIDLRDTLFTLLMDSGSTSLSKVVLKLKELDQQLAFEKLIDYYTRRPSPISISKVVKLSVDSDLIDGVLTKAWTLNLKLGLAFTIEASAFGFDYKPVLEQKLNDSEVKPILCQSLLEFLETRSAQDFEKLQSATSSVSEVLKITVVYYLLEKLKTNKSFIDPERLKQLQLLLLTTYPRLINFGCGHDKAILANGENNNIFSPQVEQEMKSYYSKMYSKEMELKEIVDMLVRMKVSDDPHDQDVFSCMIHSLLDEYRFFPEYPLTALASTSLLFGALLQKDLIQGTTLTVALNFIWESCNQPQDSHLFKFAIQSLYNFKSRLHEYPSYCKHLLECQSLSAHAKMYQIVKDAANGIPCPESTTSNASSNVGEGVGSPLARTPEDSSLDYQSMGNLTLNVTGVEQEKPPENVSDKLLFFLNNMTTDNLETKLPEIKAILTENYFLWFANYLVIDRAKVEPNNHTLYADLVEKLDNENFYNCVLSISLKEGENIIKYSKDTSNERNKLKNMGAWIGKITLANDRPLKRSQVALKFLLIEGFDFKTLNMVLPFVCKILDQAQYSRVFKYPNPWLIGILKVLAELYECADLKLTLKFEIEVLLNVFNIRVSDIEPSTIVRTHNPKPAALAALFGSRSNIGGVTSDLAKLGIDPSEKALNEPHSAQLHQLQLQHLLQQQQGLVVNLSIPSGRGNVEESSQSNVPPQGPLQGNLDTSFSTLVGNTIFTQNPNLRRAFQASLSRAVRECAVPILSRVSEAVLTTTEALIKKDFAYEQDVSKLQSSYQVLALQLSHSMVVCSGRKILGETIESTMLQLLSSQINPSELPLADLALAVQSNVDLCVDIVDKIAAGNISELINERMQKHILAREKQGATKPFVNDVVSEAALNLPQPLGLRMEGLTNNQLKIYESFGSNGPSGLNDANSNTGVANVSNLQPASTTTPDALAALSTVPPPDNLTPQQQLAMLQQEDSGVVVERLFSVITLQCEKAIQLLSETKETKLADLSPDHPIMVALMQALTIAQNNAVKFPDLLLKSAQYAVNCLFTQNHENPMSNEIFIVILDKVCEYSPSTAKDVTWWLVHSSDQRKFNIPVMHSLLKVQLVDPAKLDLSIGKLIEESQTPVVVKFAAGLLSTIFSVNEVRPIALRSEFGVTLSALSTYNADDSAEEREARKACKRLFEILSTPADLALNNTDNEPDLIGHMGYVFAEWIKVLSHGDQCEKLQLQFIDSLIKSSILVDPKYFEAFFKAATEIAVTSFATEHEIRTKTQREAYLVADAFAILIVKIVLCFEKSHAQDSIDYFKKIMSLILLVLTNDHETAKYNWNERAYFRVFSSLLCTWNDASTLDEKATSHLDEFFYTYLGEYFSSLQPLIYPGFTFAWISLIGHRMFLPRLLELPDRKGYASVVKLLSSILKFESTYTKDENVQHDVINVIFKAVNRLFVGLSHDYPDFLAECHYQLITAVPQDYVQLKNIILSATPSHVLVIDPFTQGLKVERLPEINESPIIAHKPVEDLSKVNLKKPIENFLRIPSPALIRSIYSGVKLNQPKEVSAFGFDTVHYNVKLINALVLHTGINAVAERPNNNVRGFNTKSANVSLLADLMNLGSLEFKFHLINAIVNQLRYPNSHTHWFIGIILHFFSASSIWSSPNTKPVVQEIIIRVLLERHIVNKPHPWGLTIVFTELVKNGDYGFFDLPVVKAASPELKLIFEALARNVKGTTC